MISIKDRQEDWMIMQFHILKVLPTITRCGCTQRAGAILFTAIIRTEPVGSAPSTAQIPCTNCPIPCCHCRISAASAVMAEYPEHPWYIGAALGKSQIEDFSSNSMRYDLILGWQPLSYLAIEASYINLGKYTDASAPDPLLRIDGFGGALLGFLPINDRVKVTGRLGLHRLDIEHGFEAMRRNWRASSAPVRNGYCRNDSPCVSRSSTLPTSPTGTPRQVRSHQPDRRRALSLLARSACIVALKPRRSARATRASGG